MNLLALIPNIVILGLLGVSYVYVLGGVYQQWRRSR